MPRARFRNLAQYGVITDVPEKDLPVNAWTDALNVRFESGKLSNIGGWDIVSGRNCLADQTPMSVINAPLSKGHYFYTTDKFLYSVFPNDNYNSSDPSSFPELRYNITPLNPTSGVATPDYDAHTDYPIGTKVNSYQISEEKRWQATNISDRLVFNTVLYEPLSQNDVVTDTLRDPLVPLKGWGVGMSQGANAGKKAIWRAERIHAYRDYLMALNMTESKTYDSPTDTINLPYRVRWSDVAFEGQVPQNWFEDDDTGEHQGGWLDLSDATTPIIDGLGLRNYFMVYTQTETYLFNWVGGEFIFNQEKVFNDAGILAPGCVCEYDGQHVVVTADDVIIHDGSQKKSIIQGVIRDRLLGEISSVNPRACRIIPNPVRREVWICYPYDPNNLADNTRYALNRAAVYNFQAGTWTFTELPDIYDAAVGELIDKTPQSGWDTGSALQPTNEAFDSADYPYEITTVRLGDNYLFAPSAKKCLFYLDYGTRHYEPNFTDPTTDPTAFRRYIASPYKCYVERNNIDMDEAVEEFDRVKTWRTIYPQMQGEGEFVWRVGGSNIPGGTTTQKTGVSFTVGKNYKVDTFLSKRFINIHIDGNGDCEWNWSTYDVDYVIEGRR